MFKKRELIKKKCTKCGKEKVETEFSRDSRNKDGLRSRCKACVRDYEFKKNPEKYSQKMARFYR